MRIVLVGHSKGIASAARHVGGGEIVGIIGAEIRPQYFDGLEALATLWRVPFLVQPLSTSKDYESFVASVESLRPDLMLVNGYSMKLRQDVLTLFRYATVNIHGALLPQYRGANPIQWAMLNDERETGVTMHYMNDEIDAGDIIAQLRVPMPFDETWCDIVKRLETATDELLANALPLLLERRAPRVAQDERMARYFGRRKAEDGKIDWSWPVRHIYNLIRALVKPHPGAFYCGDNGKVILDEYLSIDKVARLKYEMHPPKAGPRFELKPRREGSNHSLTFDVSPLASGVPPACAMLRGIDYDRNTASLEIDISDLLQSQYDEIAGLLCAYATSELGVAVERVAQNKAQLHSPPRSG